MSFMRFLDLTISDDVSDSKMVWAFRKKLINLDLVEILFTMFLDFLERLNLVVNEGKIPQEFKENHYKKSQKDCDTRWTKKYNVNYFGFI